MLLSAKYNNFKQRQQKNLALVEEGNHLHLPLSNLAPFCM